MKKKIMDMVFKNLGDEIDDSEYEKKMSPKMSAMKKSMAGMDDEEAGDDESVDDEGGINPKSLKELFGDDVKDEYPISAEQDRAMVDEEKDERAHGMEEDGDEAATAKAAMRMKARGQEKIDEDQKPSFLNKVPMSDPMEDDYSEEDPMVKRMKDKLKMRAMR